MTTTTDDYLSQTIAHEFSRIIRAWLTPKELAEIIQRNRANPPSICATHDFCDANVAMAEAFETVTGTRPRPVL